MQNLLARLQKEGSEDPKQFKLSGRIVYVVNHAYPFSSNGYAVRTHGVASALVGHEHSVIVVTRPGMPWDLAEFEDQSFSNHHEIDGVRYLHLLEPSSVGISRDQYLAASTETIKSTLRIFKPSAVLAASNWENALPAAVAAKELGVPFFYEVRGFWEISALSTPSNSKLDEKYQQSYEMETRIARYADKVFTLNQFMRNELIKRGVEPNKIELVPNAYGHLPALKSSDYEQNTAIKSRYVLGYVGSFGAYEGLEDLVRACAQIRKMGIDASLLIVGSSNCHGVQEKTCATSAKLQQLAQSLEFADHLHLPGRVDPTQLQHFYDQIDLIVIPRLPLAICELVSPIKPLEAIAFGKPILVSDVAPLKEFVTESAAGICFKAGDQQDLVEKACQLLENAEQRQELANNGKQWQQNHQWGKATTAISQALKAKDQIVTANKNNSFTNFPLKSVRVACIMDEFTFASYKDTSSLLQLSPETWQEELTQFKPHLLFIESAWRGKNNAWDRKIGRASPELLGIIAWCKQHGVPTMFWNKEDPVHYTTFIHTTKLFDCVFTTDINCIANYKRDLGHNNVFLLPFACNPIDHNPIEKYVRKDIACFAGSYYVRYPERAKDLEVLLECFTEHSGVDIYDRNFGQEDSNYAFPEKYSKYILGNLKYEQIDLAYKGYQYGINLNSVKFSQTMFARRVYELMASNTFVVSNYAKGVRLQFGDLVICSDIKHQILEKINYLKENKLFSEKLRLAALRKVMLQHTYEDRFAYIANKTLAKPIISTLPEIQVFTKVNNKDELRRVLQLFRGQSYNFKTLYLLAEYAEKAQIEKEFLLTHNEKIIRVSDFQSNNLPGRPQTAWVAYFDVANYYGSNYLVDLALTLKYCQPKVITKGTYYRIEQTAAIDVTIDASEYSFCSQFYYEASLICPQLVPDFLKKILKNDLRHSENINLNEVFSIDRFNYCKSNVTQGWPTYLTSMPFMELENLYEGIHVTELLRRAESIVHSKRKRTIADTALSLPHTKLYEILDIRSAKNRGILCTLESDGLKITTSAEAESPYYIYTPELTPIEKFWPEQTGKFFLETTPGLEIAPVMIFFNEKKERIGHSILIANWNQLVNIPKNTTHIRLGLRVSGGPNNATVTYCTFDHEPQSHRIAWVKRSPILLIAPNYPNKDDYYCYAFVHRRVLGYKRHQIEADVFKFRENADYKLYEFDNVDVVTGGTDVLSSVTLFGEYKTIAIHALNEQMWRSIERHLDNCKIIIWLHGAEIQAWHRRMFNYGNELEITQAQANGEKRDRFWRGIFSLRHPNIHFVFVSSYFYQEVVSDLGVSCIPENVHIIHNPIDTNLFKFQKKPVSQRKKILSIRPYASRVYANDLMVKAIEELSNRPFFSNLEFLIVGDGKLFEETVAPLRKFPNITIRKCFISQPEIAALHREYGIFLCPSRMDTQGVSRDEAMASGLVPITNKVGAIPEFLDGNSGFLCPPEDYRAIANSIEQLYNNEAQFERMSEAAVAVIRSNRTMEKICEAEVSILK